MAPAKAKPKPSPAVVRKVKQPRKKKQASKQSKLVSEPSMAENDPPASGPGLHDDNAGPRRSQRNFVPSSPGRVCVPHHHDRTPGPSVLKDATTKRDETPATGFYSAADLKSYISKVPRRAPRKRRSMRRHVNWSQDLEW